MGANQSHASGLLVFVLAMLGVAHLLFVIPDLTLAIEFAISHCSRH